MATENVILMRVVGALAGSMLFLAAAAAPKVFQALPAEDTGAILRSFFLIHYLWGLLSAASALIAVWTNTFVNQAPAAPCRLR